MHISISKTKHGLVQRKTFQVLLPAIIIVFACVMPAQAQRSGRTRPTATETIRHMQRVELERLLLLAPLKKESDPTTAAALKQLREDFKAMQNVNNKMMAQVWEREEIDYGHVSGMISEIKDRATRLRTNLLLPESKLAKKAPLLDASSAKEFRAVLMVLDQSIMSFVNNPLFRKSNVVEMNLATKAHEDLDVVIDLSGNAKKIAAKLSETSRQGH